MYDAERTPSRRGRWTKSARRQRPLSDYDWNLLKTGVDLAAVGRRLLGEPPGRNSNRGPRLWWKCPFHPDRNPSFCILPGDSHWKCFGCGASGDAVSLAMQLRRVGFREAIEIVLGSAPNRRHFPAGRLPWPKRPAAASRSADPDAEETQARARLVAEAAAERIWTPEGRAGLDYLRNRGLSDPTIRLARLGWVSESATIRPGAPRPGGGRYRGITIPWYSSDGLEMLKVRQPNGREPRYVELYRRQPRYYPGPPSAELPDRDNVVVVEGEFDALLLGQEIAGLAIVITTGSASSRPDEMTRDHVSLAYQLFLASDADDAGDAHAENWPARRRRIRPVPPHKDWTEMHLAGKNLRWWWMPRLYFTPSVDADERAGIMEFEGGLSRDDADRAAGLWPDPDS